MTALPAGWAEIPTSEAGSIGLGRQRSPKYHDGPNMKPYLRVANVFEDRIDASDVKTMHFEPADFERFRLLPGDVLLNEGQSPELLGRPAVYRGLPADVAFTNSLIRFKCSDAVLPDWALAVFRQHMHSGRFSRESRITTNIAHLSANRLATVEFRVPPMSEQERIVTAIEEAFSKLDAGEAGLRTARQRLKRLRDSVVDAAISGRLVPQDPTDSKVALNGSRIDDDDAHELGLDRLPPAWSWVPIESTGDGSRYATAIGPFGSNLKVDDYRETGVPLVFVRNIRKRDFQLTPKYITHDKAAELQAHAVRPGDVVVTKMGDPPGDTAVYPSGSPGVITADCIKVSTCIGVSASYLAIAISGGETRRRLLDLAGGVAQQKITLAGFRRLPVPLPPSAEQHRIVAELERQFSFIDACERAIDVGLARSAALRRSVLKSAFEGRLVPQDPSDEPASVLLDRIRSERDASAATRRKREVRS
jgi:type I restriction enzyme, S subunit